MAYSPPLAACSRVRQEMGDTMSTEFTEGAQPSSATPRGRPFQKGNSGRPKGTRNKATLAVEQLLDGQAEAITAKVIELALEGDRTAIRICLDRIAAVRTDRPIFLDLPDLKSVADCANAMALVVAAVARGEITPTEGTTLSDLISRSEQSLKTKDLEERIEFIEKKLEELPPVDQSLPPLPER